MVKEMRLAVRIWKNTMLLVIAAMITLAVNQLTVIKEVRATVQLEDAQPVRSVTRAAAQVEAEWTIMLYQDADDEVLEEDILIDFNEAEIVGSSDEINIVAQIDRFDGGFDGMDDWTSTKRFYVTQDSDTDEIGSEELEDLGETNMADRQTLIDFIVWAVENYPAKKYALIMSDHGAGWPGGWNDPDPGGLGPDTVSVADLFGVDGIWLMEMDQALAEARAETGIDKFELIGFDACLMGQLEVFSMVEPHAHYSVASQELEPGVGWAYAGFLGQLTENPGMDGADLSASIVSTYIDDDARITDDKARQVMLDDSFGGSEASAAELADLLSLDITLTAIDLAEIAAINAALDNLVTSLAAVDLNAVAEARAYAQTFESVFGEDTPSPYIDLINFAQLVAQFSEDSNVSAAADELISAVNQAIIAEKHGPERPGATGVTIHFPTSELYSTFDNWSYTTIASRFAEESQWDEFLAAFYSGATFSRPQSEPTALTESIPMSDGLEDLELTEEDLQILSEDVDYLLELEYPPDEIPQAMVDELGYELEFVQALLDVGFFEDLFQPVRSRSTTSNKPLEITPLTLSAEIATAEAPVVISTEISGERLAYIFTFIGHFLPRKDVLLIDDMDYLIADDSQEIGGIAYPVWPKGGISVDYSWEPTIFAISNGTNSVKALFRPETYDPESPTFAAEGIYTFAESQQQRYAKIHFRDGLMTKIFSFSGSLTQPVGAPREITPRIGDTFTVLERGDDLSLDGEAGYESYVVPSETLTFEGKPFFIEAIPAPSGNYVVGFIAQDLDGKTYEQYEGLFVVNEETEPVDGFVSYVDEDLGFASLYPEGWTVESDAAAGTVDIFDENSSAVVSISVAAYDEATNSNEADTLALQGVIETLQEDGDLENLVFLTEQPEEFTLGAFDAKVIDFDFELDGVAYSASVIASTPTPDATYLVLNLALAEEFEGAVVDVFDPMLYSFDLLLSGIAKENIGPPPPDIGQLLFSDDFSDATSGLINLQQAEDWGTSYYSTADNYRFELNPYAGPIYDYYVDESLPSEFLLQATGTYEGAVDNDYGLVFQLQVGEEFDQFYSFDISGDGYFSASKVIDGELINLIEWTPSSLIDQTENGENVLTIEGRGDRYSLYINGSKVAAFSDADLNGGSFGFVADNYDEVSATMAIFDDLLMGLPAE